MHTPSPTSPRRLPVWRADAWPAEHLVERLLRTRQRSSLVSAALILLVVIAGCAQTPPDDPSSTSAQPSATSVPPTSAETSASGTAPSTEATSTAPPPSGASPSAAPSSAPPKSGQTSSASEPPGPTGSGFETALVVPLPDQFGAWSKLESRQEGNWTIAVYSELSQAQISEVYASKSPGATFEEVVAELIGPDATQVSTGAVCTSRAGVAGCAQQQDGLTVTLTSPNMGEAQVAEALAQLLAALR